MLLKHRPPPIKPETAKPHDGLDHIDPAALAVLRWLNANKVDYVLVGPVAHSIRGDLAAKGAVAIVLAPYDRNFERLCSALVAEHAGLRSQGPPGLKTFSAAIPVKLTAEKLARGRRWFLRVRDYDLDIEGEGPPAARYQELLYEAGRFDLAEELSVEVASPEDLEHYSHVRRTGSAPEFRLMRRTQVSPEIS